MPVKPRPTGSSNLDPNPGPAGENGGSTGGKPPAIVRASISMRARTLLLWLACGVGVAATLFVVHRKVGLAPGIAADNAYIFLAADRFYDGLGLTATPPRAPRQPWEWHADWTFLTQWPAGYPLLLCAARWVTGFGTARAATSLGVLACAVALVGWFAWFRICLPRRFPATLLAMVGAGASFSVGNLINPSSDGLLVALMPMVLLLAAWVLGFEKVGSATTTKPSVSLAWVVVLGVVAGSLFWIRYVGLFVAVGLGVFLIVEWLVARRIRAVVVGTYALASLAPVVLLLAINRLYGDSTASLQTQLNLGTNLSLHLEARMFADAWRHFTTQTLYAHRAGAYWFFVAGLPVAGLVLPRLLGGCRVLGGSRVPSGCRWLGGCRVRSREVFAAPGFALSAVMVCTLIAFLISTSSLFAGKYDYVSQARYYQPIRPLYFLLFVGPLVVAGGRLWRGLMCVPLVLAGAWFVNQDARRTIARWQSQPRPVTEYGRWARRFEPDSPALYSWLKARRDDEGDELIVFSNFHEEIALETGIPACPTPQDRKELDAWLDRIRATRGVDHLDVLFALDPDNSYRDYYLTAPEEIVRQFKLHRVSVAPTTVASMLYRPRP